MSFSTDASPHIDALSDVVNAADAEVARLLSNAEALASQLASSQAARLTLEQRIRDLEAQLAASGGVPTGWRVTFEDKFTGGAVDASKWNIRNGTTQSNMDGRNWAKNVTVKDGALSIGSGAPGTDGKWPCGYLDTIGKFSQQYGRWEARARVPWGADATGFWPAFWLRPDDGGNGEIDIMEAWPARSQIGPAVHHDYLTTAAHIPHRSSPVPVTGWAPDDWHVYAVEWEKGAMRFYIDDRLVWAPSYTDFPWLSVFDRPMKYNIRLNLQMGGTWGGKPNSATNLAQTFDVDRVRVFTKA